MTEKGEDQVVLVKKDELTGVPAIYIGQKSDDEYWKNAELYIPHSKYLALQKNLEGAEYIIDVEHRRNNKLESDLAVAVEALRRIAEPSSEDIVIPIRKIAKEALGKIGGGK